jgi:tetratricopeptide (TPR) repeat protein
LAPAEFTGRTEELAWLSRSVDAGANAMVISALSGTGGIGKTALALHWAHGAAADLPDGQLHVNLRGHALVPPMDPAEALARFLRALGAPEKQIPIDADERAATYRSLVAGRRMLVMLDNAASADQVRPLLPGTATCIVLITSRADLRGLTALDGAHRIVLDALDPDEAHTLLDRTVGEARTRAEPDAVSRLVQLCDRLPLALRIAAGQLARYPRQPIADYVAQLADGDRLTRLSVPGDHRAAVRASFDLSYRKLTTEPARLFRLLGLAPTPDFTPHTAAALGEIPVDQAAALLDQLSAVHLLESSVPDRFHSHDLLRLYAAERADQEDGRAGCAAAVRRLYAFYLRTVDAAARLIYPDQSSLLDDAGPTSVHFAAKADALAWMDAERAGVVAVVRHAAESGELRTCWQLGHAAGAYFFAKMDLTDWWETIQVGLDAAERAGDLRGRIALVSSLAQFAFTVADYDRALDCGEQALQLIGQSGGYPDEASIIRMRGLVCWLVGRLDDAVGHFDRAARLYQRDRNPLGEAHARIGLAAVSDDRGNWDDALDHAGAALDLGQRSDSLVSVGLALHSAAGFLGWVGRFSEAIDLLPEILARYRAANAVYHEPSWYQFSATIYRDLGELTRARADAEKAVQLARAIGERRTEAHSLNVLGAIAARTGQSGDAVELHEAALRLATRLRLRKAQAEANIGMTAALSTIGRPQEALLAGETAIAIAREHGYVHCEGGALLAIAGVYLATGQSDLAADNAEQAFTIHRRTGHRLGEARALRTLGQIAADRHEPTATRHRVAALQILDELGCTSEADELRSLVDM